MKNHYALVDCAVPIFRAVHKTLKTESLDSSVVSQGLMLKQLLLEFEKMTFENQIPSHHVHDAKYALAALIDETLLKLNVPDRDQWISHLIQVELFGEHLAGEHFFKWLERVKSSGRDYVGVLEVYYVCLKMGFTGRYAVEGQEKLNALHVDIKHALSLHLGIVDPSLSLPVEKSMATAVLSREFPWWGYYVCAFGLTMFVYFIYLMLIHRWVVS